LYHEALGVNLEAIRVKARLISGTAIFRDRDAARSDSTTAPFWLRRGGNGNNGDATGVGGNRPNRDRRDWHSVFSWPTVGMVLPFGYWFQSPAAAVYVSWRRLVAAFSGGVE
jgi:hypothetical protein